MRLLVVRPAAFDEHHDLAGARIDGNAAAAVYIACCRTPKPRSPNEGKIGSSRLQVSYHSARHSTLLPALYTSYKSVQVAANQSS